MARSREDFSTSVDAAFNLFMDTIANAFGGIVLIAMAVCILLQMTSDATDEKELKAKEALEYELADIRRENDRLSKLTDDLATDVPATDPKLADLARGLREKTRQAEAAKAKALESLAKVEKELSELQVKTTGQLKNAAFATEFMGLKREYDELLKQRYKKTSAPAQSTTKEQVPYLLSNGLMVSLVDLDPKTGKKSLNTKEVEENVSEKGKRYFKPKTGKGMKIEDTPECRQRLAEMFAKLNPQKQYLGFCVWPDSFKEYAILRKAAVEAKLGFYLVLLQKDAMVSASGPSEEIGGGSANP